MATTLATSVVPATGDTQKWLDWSNYHRNLFGWQNPADGQMVNTWIGFFRRGGYSPEELFAATDLSARQTEKIYKREDHLATLQTHLHALRQQSRLRQQAPRPEDHRGNCAYCGDTGAVSVPLLRDVIGMTWTSRKTSAVWCTCWQGRQFHATRNSKGEPMMGLPGYTHKNPHWRRQIEDARSQDVEAELLRTEAVEAGGIKAGFDNARERLMHSWGLLPGEKPARQHLATDGVSKKQGVDLTAARAAFEARGPWQKEARTQTTWDREFAQYDLLPKTQTPTKKGK